MFEEIRSHQSHQSRLPGHHMSTSSSGVQNSSQTRAGRNVEQKNGLRNVLSNLLEGLSESFKPINDFLCKHFSWENLMKFGRDTKHQAKQGLYDLRKEVAGSKLERTRLEAQKQKEDLQYKGTEQVGAIKNRLKHLFD